MPKSSDRWFSVPHSLRYTYRSVPGYRLHPLKGDLKGYWSISISGNWRVTFRIDDGDAYDVDLTDYH